MRDFDVFRKILKGSKITKIKPVRLLIKKREKRKILFQKSSILKLIKILATLLESLGPYSNYSI